MKDFNWSIAYKIVLCTWRRLDISLVKTWKTAEAQRPQHLICSSSKPAAWRRVGSGQATFEGVASPLVHAKLQLEGVVGYEGVQGCGEEAVGEDFTIRPHKQRLG